MKNSLLFQKTVLFITIPFTCMHTNLFSQNYQEFTAEPLLDAQAKLGEGALWNHETKNLYWIDIQGKALHLFHPESKQNQTFDMGKLIGTVVPENGMSALVALQDGIYRVDLENGQKNLIINPDEKKETTRFNDGKCDPAGRFWVGTMGLKGEKGAGGLYCMYHDNKMTRVIENVTISNGIVWSGDKKTMYYIDTPTQQVKAYDYDPETGAIQFRAIAVQIPDSLGYPDGMAIDSEDNLWIGMWSGHGITAWDPAKGQLIAKVSVPVPNVTSCAFGGENLDILYITTAGGNPSNDERNKYPYAGGLFQVKLPYKGIPANFYKGK
jgi:sugar lactone lactonase YvrE